MTAKKCKLERRRRGSKHAVAALLEFHPFTLDKRENGRIRVNKEAELALLTLPTQPELAPTPKRGAAQAAGKQGGRRGERFLKITLAILQN